MSFRTSRLAAGTSSAVRSPPDGLTSGSASPWITSVGTSRVAQPVGAVARGDDGGELARRALGMERAVVVSAGRLPGALGVEVPRAADHLGGVRASARCTPRARSGGGVIRAAIASGVGWPTRGSPVVDMIEVSVRTRSGCSMAIVWAIIPPIDAPTTWAVSMPRASSSPTASSAMSESV